MALTFTEKTVIVSDFYEYHSEDYPEIIAAYDLGFPLAFAVVYEGVVELTETGKSWIEDAYKGICEALGVDQYGDYDSLTDLMEFSDEQG